MVGDFTHVEEAIVRHGQSPLRSHGGYVDRHRLGLAMGTLHDLASRSLAAASVRHPASARPTQQLAADPFASISPGQGRAVGCAASGKAHRRAFLLGRCLLALERGCAAGGSFRAHYPAERSTRDFLSHRHPGIGLHQHRRRAAAGVYGRRHPGHSAWRHLRDAQRARGPVGSEP